MYDHRSDPNEWTNLAANPAHNALKARLAQLLPKAAGADHLVVADRLVGQLGPWFDQPWLQVVPDELVLCDAEPDVVGVVSVFEVDREVGRFGRVVDESTPAIRE